MEGWTIGELATQAAQTLGAADAPDGRVTPTPDLRMVRYYTTLGLLDRALEFRGRTAIYGRRHLLQLVAIKRLQAKGSSLAEIQQQLVGATDQRLAELAGPSGIASPKPKPAAAPPPVEERFWEAAPAVGETAFTAPAEALPNMRRSVRIEVAPGIAILIEGAPSDDLSNVDWKSIEPAVRNLASALADAGLIQE